MGEGRFGADGCLSAFTVSLPEADIIHQPVGVGINSLFALIYAPYPDTVLNEPFNHEWSFFGSSAETVEHEYQEDIKLLVFCSLPDFLQDISVICTDLEAGHASFLLFHHNDPAHFFSEVSARFALHGDICLIITIVIHLLVGGDSI